MAEIYSPSEITLMNPQSLLPLLKIEALSKSFSGNKIIDDVSFAVRPSEVIGIIGRSGAGKSTLLRCLNMLEVPDSGHIWLGEEEIGFHGAQRKQVTQRTLARQRASMTMVFQHFNLFPHMNVTQNLMLAPVELKKATKEEAKERAIHMLKKVGMDDKAEAYPEQLSGGQKQRVAIARALASNPKILLCDEATSALDLQTTKAILELIKEINRDYGITVVVITHEMSVIKSIANRVAVMENGKVVEEGDVYDIFANPKEEITKKFINSSSSLSNITKLIENKTIIPRDSKLVKLTFTRDSVGSATISKISREYNVDVNIMLANVDVVNADALGGIIASIEGNKDDIQDAINYLHASNVKVEVIHNA